MGFLAGETITATRLNRLQPKTYRGVQTSVLNGPATLADVPGCSVTLTTETANAVFVAECSYDYEIGTANGGLSSGNLSVDGTVQNQYAVFRDGGGTALTRMSVCQSYQGTLGAAGSHTIKMVASPSTGHKVTAYSSLTVTIYEVV